MNNCFTQLSNTSYAKVDLTLFCFFMNVKTEILTFCRRLNLFFLLSLLTYFPAIAQQTSGLNSDIIIDESINEQSFPIVSPDNVTAILRYDVNDYKGVVRAAGDLQLDIERVTSVKTKLATSYETEDYEIIIGTLGKSKLINELVSTGKLDEKDLRGKWESFVITTINNPKPGVKQYLVIAGSDKRGTIYGIYELSKQLGVSPWYWFADVPAKKRSTAYVKQGYYASGEPKVCYRGIFINDEEPAFGTWAREKFGGINSKMYVHIFELLLRLRANYFWPAMWGKAFNEDDPKNPLLADEYGIVMGTSHHEPMMRAQKEWTVHHDEYGNGEWNYKTNEEGLKKFWKDGLERNKNYENIVTMGMRGDGDEPMTDAGSAQENFRILEKIMNDQREIIENVTGKPASEIPQVWALYSEVLEYYDQGIEVPDDMMILLCDDNWGDVRRLPELGEEKHPGGYGIYYHVDLHGAPRAYQWLNMTQIPHMWQQLHLTYSYGVDKIWILNVGDLKPNEYPMDFFLNMAWNPESYTEDNLDEYAGKFCAEQFGEDVAKEAAEIISLYCKYNSRVSAEMMDQTSYNLESGEFLKVRDAYMALEARALRLFLKIRDSYNDAYKELILHPVQAMANLYDIYYSVAMNKKYAEEKNLHANYWADRVEYCFNRDAELSKDYNLNIADGKWNHIMDQTHIGYTSWDEPKEGNIMPKVSRVKPSETKQGGYVFSEKYGVVVIEAEHYFESEINNKTSGTVMADLGRTLSGLTLMPFTKSTSDASITYRMKIDTKSDSLKLHMIFDCTLPFKKGGHSVSAYFDGESEKSWNINKELNWDNKYTKMYPAGAERIIETVVTLPLPSATDGIYNLTIKPLDPGIVFHKIIVDDGGYEESRLKMPESPYTRN